ncbi:ribose-phosphate diphosphokinase [Arthrobacter roseus]|uniref:ribose-phosphate diphosphokinase n=1 Tax=Arthrobacter roseus TaxID=136274 RepID=UPI001963B57E|nr:ribose-phosphate pyrophosphokinase [Arthrobacter roseus]MBM7849399.1 ribose-phosphate pyrophosphokinase [Arthrobacter roseus]
MKETAVFAGSAGHDFADEICGILGRPLNPSRTQRFANDCLESQLLENCRERDVFIVQPLVYPVQENLMELLLMADAAKGASAGRITAVIPHYSYARSDKKDAPRISVGGKLVANLLKTAGVNRVLTMTLHAPQVQAFFDVPVDHLHALRELAAHFTSSDLSNTVVVSPDLGNAKAATAFSRLLGTSVAAGAKERFEDDRVVITSIIGDVKDKDVIILDDEIANGSTVLELLDHLESAGARDVRVVCTHGIFSNGAVSRIADHKNVTEIVATNTAPIGTEKLHPKLTVISVASAFAEAIRRIHTGESVSELF